MKWLCLELECNATPERSRAEGAVDMTKNVVPWGMVAKREFERARMYDDARRERDQILNHRAHTSAFDDLAQWLFCDFQAFLPQHAQHVVREHAEMQHEGVGGKLARGQTLQIQFAFDLAVKLLHGAVLVIKCDDDFGLLAQGSPIGVDFQFRRQKELAGSGTSRTIPN